jgi:hypothetical protein
MAYKDKHGITDIKTEDVNNLSISRDTDMDFNSGDEYPIACLLYTPSMKNTDIHYHIPLNVEECQELVKWLKKFIKENDE